MSQTSHHLMSPQPFFHLAFPPMYTSLVHPSNSMHHCFELLSSKVQIGVYWNVSKETQIFSVIYWCHLFNTSIICSATKAEKTKELKVQCEIILSFSHPFLSRCFFDLILLYLKYKCGEKASERYCNLSVQFHFCGLMKSAHFELTKRAA